MSGANGNGNGTGAEIPDFGALRRTVGKLALTDGGMLYPVRNMPARLLKQLDQWDAATTAVEKGELGMALVKALMPTAPPEEVEDQPLEILAGIILLAVNRAKAIELFARETLEGLDPNVTGATETSTSATPPDPSCTTSASASPVPLGAMSGA